VAGALIGLGIPEYEAKRYQDRVTKGGILLSVHSDNFDLTKKAKDILQQTGRGGRRVHRRNQGRRGKHEQAEAQGGRRLDRRLSAGTSTATRAAQTHGVITDSVRRPRHRANVPGFVPPPAQPSTYVSSPMIAVS
jgi:hypothetical protein